MESERASLSSNTSIRLYEKGDRAAVFRIGADTSFFGEPLEIYMDDRQLFCDIFYSYYTDLEPEHCWVACAQKEVVGFLTGCVNTATQRRLWARKILPVITGRILRGDYRIGRKTLRYTWKVVLSAMRSEFTHVNVALYPAHLHINLAVDWRGRGLGRGLMEAYLEQLRQLGVPGVYLDTSSENATACILYEKMGFRILDSRQSQMWKGIISKPLYNLCYGLRLIQGDNATRR